MLTRISGDTEIVRSHGDERVQVCRERWRLEGKVPLSLTRSTAPSGPVRPPLLLVHGELDPVVPFSHSEIIYRAFRELDLEATLVKVSGAGHGFQPVGSRTVSPSISEISETAVEYFITHLVLQ